MSAADFLSNAKIHTIIPQASEVNLEEALKLSLERDVGSCQLPFTTLPQRSLLFFGENSAAACRAFLSYQKSIDELVTVYIALQLEKSTDTTLKSHLPGASIRLDVFTAHAEGLQPNFEDASTRELICSGFVQDVDDPLVIIHTVDSDEYKHDYIYVIWKVDAYLRRPRTRLQQPCVVFMASATFSPPKVVVEDDYLPSRAPASLNIFEALRHDPSLHASKPHLPTSRLLHVAPSKAEGRAYRISQPLHNPIRIIPVASAKVRYSRLNTYSSTAVTMASLDFEVTPFTKLDMVLESVDLSLSAGTVTNMSLACGSGLPIVCRARDDITLVFKLIPDENGCSSVSTTATHSALDISIRALVLLSQDCRPKILMRWKTNVDFSLPLNPTFGGPSQVLQRNSRPTNLSMAPVDEAFSKIHPPSFAASSAISHDVAMSLYAPRHIEASQTFDWDVFVVNRSDKPRTFAMLVLPNKSSRFQNFIPNRAPLSILDAEDVANAVTNENHILSTTQSAATSYETRLLFLSADLKFT
ncbi:predicted protein [Uncinocarpus reesii 1704]|uniref:Trafficking protein particle complex II-specific subunit 65 IgD3 domain-containing protein n=1 Tax=Uncinocarpus reesii (strain UAMH 1704) TaxID=336963 RepID=C4JQU0_UNCRE|nr:uncharacterized protein UREG_03422 [Uncinocarpus reesii 1704]EEP78576.1 predicted protein [Uncinocarpus reesii 1704]